MYFFVQLLSTVTFAFVKSKWCTDDWNDALSIRNDSCYIDVMTNQELETVVTYVKDRLPEPATQSPAAIPSDYFHLTERIVRVEEALRNLGLIMDKRFEAIDKRFEAIDKRFEAIDKRFEDLIHQMDKRFEAMEKRLEAMDKRFEDLIHYMDKRFEAVDRRFEDMNKRFEDMNKRFEDMNKRFDAIGRRFNWTIGITTALITGLGVLITIYRFLGPVGG